LIEDRAMQILTLAKVLIDALNENKIEKNISPSPDTRKGIENFLFFLKKRILLITRRE
jgi:hypothetical protein